MYRKLQDVEFENSICPLCGGHKVYLDHKRLIYKCYNYSSGEEHIPCGWQATMDELESFHFYKTQYDVMNNWIEKFRRGMTEEDKKSRQKMLDKGWEEEILYTGVRVYKTKMSDRILTTKLSDETAYKLRKAWGKVDIVEDSKYHVKKFKNWFDEIYFKFLERFGSF